MKRRVGLVFVAAVSALAAACGPGGGEAADDAVAAKGRAERAFWACYDRARAEQSKGDVAAARTSYEEAIRHKPDHAAAIYALAGIEHRAGNFVRAIALCDRLLEVDRPRTRAYLLRAAIRSDVEAVVASGRARGDWIDLAKAEADAISAETENPEETGPHVARARIALLRGDVAAAEASLARALTIHPGHAEAMVLSGVAARARGDRTETESWVRRALAATKPKTNPFPPGEGDTEATLKALQSLDTARLRALAYALRLGVEPWPDDAPHRPATTVFPVFHDFGLRDDPLRLKADFDGDGVPDELTATRAPERDALLSLFGMHDPAKGSFTLRLGARGAKDGFRDATAGSGLEGVAACVAALVADDTDADGRVDVLVLPGDGDPSRREPPLVLRNLGAGRFEIRAITGK